MKLIRSIDRSVERVCGQTTLLMYSFSLPAAQPQTIIEISTKSSPFVKTRTMQETTGESLQAKLSISMVSELSTS